MSGENWIDYPNDGDRACIFGRRPSTAAETEHHLRTAKRLVQEGDARIAELTAERDEARATLAQVRAMAEDLTTGKAIGDVAAGWRQVGHKLLHILDEHGSDQ